MVRMDLPTALETWALLMKHVNDFAPILSAVLQEKNGKVRMQLFGKLGDQLVRDPTATKDLAIVIQNLLGQDVQFGPAIIKQLQAAWKLNEMDAWLAECRRLGLVTMQDLYDLSWILATWEISNGRSASSGQ